MNSVLHFLRTVMRHIPGKYLLYSYFPKVYMEHWKLESSPATKCSCTQCQQLRGTLRKWVSLKRVNLQKWSCVFCGGARNRRQPGVLSTAPFIISDKWTRYHWKVKDGGFGFELLERNSCVWMQMSFRCLFCEGKTYSCWGDSFPGSAAGSTLNLKCALCTSLVNVLHCLNPLKVSCGKDLPGMSALHAFGSLSQRYRANLV